MKLTEINKQLEDKNLNKNAFLELIRIFALLNASRHKGKANKVAVMKLLASHLKRYDISME